MHDISVDFYDDPYLTEVRSPRQEMAWFGDRLSQFSNLTDQISSFTKEVLTETTEEVEGSFNNRAKGVYVVTLSPLYVDPAAELQVARRGVAELEEVNIHIRTEV